MKRYIDTKGTGLVEAEPMSREVFEAEMRGISKTISGYTGGYKVLREGGGFKWLSNEAFERYDEINI